MQLDFMNKMSDIIVQSFASAFTTLWQILRPYIVEAIVGLLIMGVIQKAVKEVSLVMGCTRKEARNNAKNARNLFEPLSGIRDVFKK